MKTFEIKITGSGTKAEIIEALREAIVEIETTDEDQLDGTECEGPVIMLEVEEEGEDSPYTLVGFNEIDTPDGLVLLDESIADDEKHEYRIVCREDVTTDLMRWIGEGSRDAALMQQDLEMLLQWDDEYIFSSVSTNDYIGEHSSNFNETCEELIKINESL